MAKPVMKLTLDLLRHADAVPAGPGVGDHDRVLSTLGQRQALLVAERLQERGRFPGLVICSSATRTQQTLRVLGYNFTSVARIDPSIYETDVDRLLDVIAHLKPLSPSAMIIGHNPGLQDLLVHLLGSRAPTMSTAAWASVRIPVEPERPLRLSGELQDYHAP